MDDVLMWNCGCCGFGPDPDGIDANFKKHSGRGEGSGGGNPFDIGTGVGSGSDMTPSYENALRGGEGRTDGWGHGNGWGDGSCNHTGDCHSVLKRHGREENEDDGMGCGYGRYSHNGLQFGQGTEDGNGVGYGYISFGCSGNCVVIYGKPSLNKDMAAGFLKDGCVPPDSPDRRDMFVLSYVDQV